MRSAPLLCGLLLAATAVTANAGQGVNLRWSACFGDGGLPNRNSACASNTGLNVLVGSFVSPASIVGDGTPANTGGMTGIEIVVDVATAGAALPAWWEFQSGGCRAGALSANATIDPAAVNCLDWANGGAVGALGSYQAGFLGANIARIKIASAMLTPQDVLAGQEYFAFNAVISNVKTVGACAGCLTPACFLFRTCTLVPGTLPSYFLNGPTNSTDSNFATWQGGGGISTVIGTGCPHALPVQRRTWGAVKSLYR